MEAQFSVSAKVRLYHSHFPNHEIQVLVRVYEEASKSYKWLKPRSQKTDHGAMFRGQAKAVILRSVEWVKAVEAINQMFLAGNISLKGLKAFLPKKKCLG